MKARATRLGGFRHRISIRGHELQADEPSDRGGDDTGPSPHELLLGSLVSCTAITLEMYARRKEWDIDGLVVEAGFEQPPPGKAACFDLLVRLPDNLTDEQVGKLEVIAGRCPVHRLLTSDVEIRDRIERT